MAYRAGSTGANQLPWASPSCLHQVIELLCNNYLDSEARRSLRLTSRLLREAHDQTTRSIYLERTSFSRARCQLPSAEEVSATLRGALARGCRPQVATLQFTDEDSQATTEMLMLAFFKALAGVESVERISLGYYAPLTEAVAHALVRSAPRLSSLDIGCMDFRSPGERFEADDTTAAVVRLLLQMVGPQLRELAICPDCLPTLVLEPLVHCTALTKLCINNQWDTGDRASDLAAESSMLRAISSLTSLCELTLLEGAQPPSDAAARRARAAALESCLSPLTALTSLKLRLRCLKHTELHIPDTRKYVGLDVDDQVVWLQSAGRAEEAAQLLSAVQAEWRAVVAAARRMPKLSHLHVPARAEAADLASLTALTRLVLGGIVASDAAAPEHQQGAWAPVYELPPLLKELSVYAPLSMHVAAALRRSPAAVSAGSPLISWQEPLGSLNCHRQSWALRFLDSDVDGEWRRLTEGALATMQQAAKNLKAAFSLQPSDSLYIPARGLHLKVYGTQSEVLQPPVAAPMAAEAGADDGDGAAAAAGGGDGGNSTHCGSWLRDLMAELRPDSLKLWGFYFSPRDMLGMARCMGGLKELHIHGCSYYMSSLPLLGGLCALKQLSLRTEDWWELSHEGTPSDDVALIEGVFLALTMPAARTGRWADEEEEDEACGDAGAMTCCGAAVPLPRISRIAVFCLEGPHEELVRDGLLAVKAELQLGRPRAPYISVEVYSNEDDDANSE